MVVMYTMNDACLTGLHMTMILEYASEAPTSQGEKLILVSLTR